MGTQCSNLINQISNETPTRKKLTEFMTKPVGLNHNNSQTSNSHDFNLGSKLEFIRQIERQFIKQGGKDVFEFEKFSEDKYVVRFDDQSHYRGCVDSEGRRYKEGQQTWKDGTKYIGGWKENLPHNNGLLISPEGYTFEGEWIQGIVQGFGKYFGKTGSYQGFWSHNQPHGHGIQTWQDGSRYQGTYYEGKKHGEGKYTWPDHSTYVGQWTDGKITGLGTYRYIDGRVYTGSFRNNKMHGKGTYTWPDGRKYVGYYKEDRKWGKGSYEWPDGRYFEGEWVEGKRNGYGKIVYPNMVVKYGIWEDDKRVDEGLRDREFVKYEFQQQENQQQTYHNPYQASQTPSFSILNKRTTLSRTEPRPLYASSLSPYKQLKSYYQQYTADKSHMNERIANRYKFIQSPLRKFNQMQLNGGGSYLSMMIEKSKGKNASVERGKNSLGSRSFIKNKQDKPSYRRTRRQSAVL